MTKNQTRLLNLYILRLASALLGIINHCGGRRRRAGRQTRVPLLFPKVHGSG